MAKLRPQLELLRCPHCSIAKPLLSQVWQEASADHTGSITLRWAVFRCHSCGRMLLVSVPVNQKDADIIDIYPPQRVVDEAIPIRAREYLEQSINSLHAPAGAVMLTASAIDSMLKEKGYSNGSLYSRIDSAANHHLITSEMAAWAHEIRLDANDQRHADDNAPLPKKQSSLHKH